MAMAPPEAGWSRFLVRRKFGAGRDFSVEDSSEHKVGRPDHPEAGDDRDACTPDIAQGHDPALAAAILWAVDRWAERD